MVNVPQFPFEQPIPEARARAFHASDRYGYVWVSLGEPLLPIPDLPHSHDIWITLLLACVGKISPVDRDLIQYRLHGANQVGMRQYNLLDQIRMARHQIKTNTFSYLADMHQSACQRLL